MSTTTANYNLIKPELSDVADITAMNENWDVIDEALANAASESVTVIGGYIDLNDLYEVGEYTYSAASAATMSNVPEQAQGTLIILPRLIENDPDNIIQVVITRENSIFIRNKYDGTWKEWDKVASEATLTRQINNHGRHVPNNCAQISDWNEATLTGWYMGNNAANAPTNHENTSSSLWYFGFVITHNENYVFQEVYLFTASAEANEIPKYIRAKKDGTWGNWHKVTVQRDVPADAKLDYIKNLTGDAQVQLNNRMYAKPSFIEFNPTDTMGHGGYLDFHYNGSTEDWTTRIIEEKSGQLRIMADKLRLSGVLDISDGDAGVYGDDHTVNLVSKSDKDNDYKRSIQVMNKAYESDIADALILIDKDSTGARNYKLFGEHNLTALATALGTCKIATGTYTGTGTYGYLQPTDENANKLTFPFVPKLLIITSEYSNAVINYQSVIQDGYMGGFCSNIIAYCDTSVSDDGLTLKWWTPQNDPKRQHNTQGEKYHWMIIG